MVEKKISILEDLPPLTGSELKTFYNNLKKINADDFRNEVKERCDWTTAVWQTRINNKTQITKLESEAIRQLMRIYEVMQ